VNVLDTLTFLTKRSYSASQSGIEVPIGLLLDDSRSVWLLAKVDTGASFCIFQKDYAVQLGIDVESGLHKVVATPTGRLDVYGHAVRLSCFEWEFETTVYFAASEGFIRNVVGRVGWLEHFRLGLIDHDSTLYLSRYED
jgi:hypothetical protein